MGVDPDVLINNTTYPIPLQALEDKDIAISLDKFQTKVTPVTDDELYAISVQYDKMSRVKESHANARSDAKFAESGTRTVRTGEYGQDPRPQELPARQTRRQADIVLLLMTLSV